MVYLMVYGLDTGHVQRIESYQGPDEITRAEEALRDSVRTDKSTDSVYYLSDGIIAE